MTTTQSTLIWVMYDSMNNSIFESQVAQPLIQYTQNYSRVILVSFEQANTPIQSTMYPFEIKVLKKYRFWGRSSLYPAIRALRKFLKTFNTYELIARGPIAGYLCRAAARDTVCQKLTIQARGLLAEEYRYTNAQANGWKSYIHTYRAYLYEKLEQKAYRIQEAHIPTTIEAVSDALAAYLVKHYKIPAHLITIAQQDIPAIIPELQKKEWRSAIRTTLNVPDNTFVYCYNGSAKAWQCAQETTDFFVQEYAHNSHSFLLVLTQDVDIFKQLLRNYALPESAYHICTVKQHDLYRYLAACDAGIVLRKPHILNWISRPTKVLDYQAVGLSIVHNNTISMLRDYSYSRVVHI